MTSFVVLAGACYATRITVIKESRFDLSRTDMERMSHYLLLMK